MKTVEAVAELRNVPAKHAKQREMNVLFATFRVFSGHSGNTSVFLIGAAVAALACLTGCAGVKPWQRGHLADYTMRPDRDTLETGLRDHIFFTREAAAGGRGVGGGGCGCN